MPKLETYQLHPTGWESDPAEERFKLATIDYMVARVWVQYAIFFKMADADRPKVVETLKRGLERTLSQARHLCGTIEKDPGGGHSFVKKKDSTVEFQVQWLDGPEDAGKYPTLEELEKKHYVSQALGNVDDWSVKEMTYGEKPEAHPDASPRVSAFKANFIKGGLVFLMHNHHFANDVMGWAGELHQLAENCNAIWTNDETAFPPWDPKCLDWSMITKADVPAEQQVEGPAAPERHPDHKVGQWLLFHLPKSKASELKKAASPADGSYWISSYDAFNAMIWRTLTRVRQPLYRQDPATPLLWGEAVDMRRRFTDPRVPERIQGNVVFVALSAQAAVPPMRVAQVLGDDGTPLSKLAWYVRQLTNGTTQQNLDAALTAVAPVRDKTSLFLRTDAFPPMSNFTTEWRDTRVAEADFGFGKPVAFRHPLSTVTAGLTVVLPPRSDDPALDQGPEFLIGFEKELTDKLVNDPEWTKYFEFRGVDAEESLARAS